jgi:hypothetical protein
MSKEDMNQERRMLANSYLEIRKFQAWKDLMTQLSVLEAHAIKTIDQKSLGDLSLTDIGWIKGVRETVRKIHHHIETVINEGP